MIAIAILGTEVSKERDLNQKTIDGLLRANKAQRDSLEKHLEITRDSLQIAFETIRQATKEREEAHLRTQKMMKNYESILYIKYENDSTRINALKRLYPTWQ